ncbi:MAG: hypothetical protein AAF628_29215 [Planctomycetota bacterium]
MFRTLVTCAALVAVALITERWIGHRHIDRAALPGAVAREVPRPAADAAPGATRDSAVCGDRGPGQAPVRTRVAAPLEDFEAAMPSANPRPLTVHVLGPTGAPLGGIELGIVDRPVTGESAQPADCVPLGVTDGSGALELADASTAVASARDRLAGPELAIGTEVPGAGWFCTPFNLDHLPATPLRLVLRGVRPARVEVFAPTGEPVTAGLRAWWITGDHAPRTWAATSVSRHEAHFAAVAVDVAAEVLVRVGSATARRAVAAHHGAGSEIAVRVDLPATGRVVAELSSATTTPDDTAQLLMVDGDYRGDRRFDRDGRVTFDDVPIRASFELRAVVSGVVISTPLRGPTTPQQEVVTRLAWPDDVTVIRGRALDPAGAPMRECGLRVALRRADATSISTVQTDADGHFRVAWQSLGDTPTSWLEIAATDAEREPTPSRARFESLSLPHGDHDLGEVRLRPQTPLIAGQLRGDPLTDARVSLRVERLSGTRWLTVQPIDPQIEASGTFRLYGAAPPGRLRLVVDSEDVTAVEPVEFTPGATDLVLDLHLGGQLCGAVVVDPGVAPTALRFALRPVGVASGLERRADVGLLGQDAEGSTVGFFWRGVPVGRYDLVVTVEGQPTPIAEVRDLTVHAGSANEDSRLTSMDLRGRIAVPEQPR